MKKRIGLIGAGRVGKVHAQSISELNNAELTIVADVFVDGAKQIAEQHGGDYTDDPGKVLDTKKVDMVIIASPTNTHVDLIDKGIQTGIPVMCEKPIDLDISKVDALADKVRRSETPVMIGFNRRFDPSIQEVHSRTRAGEIGNLEQLLIVSRDPAPASMDYLRASGGIFRDMTIHDFDMARNFIPNIRRVTARGFNQFSKEIADIPDYDSTSVILESEKGQLVQITNSRHSAFGFDQRLEAFGTEGMLRVENVTDTTVRHFDSKSTERSPPFVNFFLERYTESFRVEISEFIKVIEGENLDYPTFEDGRMALILANAALESSKSGTTVEVGV